MIFGTKRKRDIVDFDLELPDGWHGVQLDIERRDAWVNELVEETATDLAQQNLLRQQLFAVHAQLLESVDQGITGLVWIPEDEHPHVKCVLVFRSAARSPSDTPDSYQATLDDDRGRNEAGEKYHIVSTWQVAINAGIAVGAYNLITYDELGEDLGRTEARTVIAVFPAKAAQVLEFIFTTQDTDLFDTLVDVSMASIATVTVELGR